MIQKIQQIVYTLIFTMLAAGVAVSCGNNEKKATQDTVVAASPAPVASEGLPTVIDFYATWCGPCRQMAPVFEVLKGEYGGKIEFRSIDVDQDPDMAARYNISSIPTFVFLDAGGKEVKRITGADAQGLSSAVDAMALGK